ncbi:hypothetical protein EOL99_03445 [Candidatus Falkowbacteria bacterium]|nr:hypothetical protein [Candidatus Falkowbacteria bacterium]
MKMIKEVVVSREGFEDIFEILNNKIEKIEDEKKVEIEKAVADIEIKYQSRLEDYRNTLNSVSEVKTEEVEEPVAEEIAGE